MDFKTKIREVPNWPKQGVNFKDVTTLLQDKDTFKMMIDKFIELTAGKNIDKVVGIDARGFLLAATIAYNIDAGLSIVRKAGKLPHETIEEEYELEYGKGVLQMHKDTIAPGDAVLICDDLIATGGTALATCNLIEQLGGKIIGICVIVDLPFLGGSKKLKDRGYRVDALVSYDEE
jgi:adenine phosphoribosyltransferase